MYEKTNWTPILYRLRLEEDRLRNELDVVDNLPTNEVDLTYNASVFDRWLEVVDALLYAEQIGAQQQGTTQFKKGETTE